MAGMAHPNAGGGRAVGSFRAVAFFDADGAAARNRDRERERDGQNLGMSILSVAAGSGIPRKIADPHHLRATALDSTDWYRRAAFRAGHAATSFQFVTHSAKRHTSSSCRSWALCEGMRMRVISLIALVLVLAACPATVPPPDAGLVDDDGPTSLADAGPLPLAAPFATRSTS
jgi:hypothetical protein